MIPEALRDQLLRKIQWEDLDPRSLLDLIDLARREDLEGWGLKNPGNIKGDVTSSLFDDSGIIGRATLVARQELVLCGNALVPLILDSYGSGLCYRQLLGDGSRVKAGSAIGIVEGSAPTLLRAERILLNFLQRLCGIATLTGQFVAALQGSRTCLLDTRKTTPGYRALEKYAVVCGGGYNHRMGLFDRLMLKDNHLAAGDATGGQSLLDLVNTARRKFPQLIIEVEVDDISQIEPTLDAGAQVILLDNFTVDQLEEAVALIGDRACTEASGGITLEKLPQLGALGLDFISTGATVHHATWKDIGLDWSI